MNILGIHDGHNSSACILSSGKIICAIQEERLRKIKNYWAVPTESIENCLKFSGLKFEDIDCVAIATFEQFTKLNGYVSRDDYMGSMKRIYDSNFSFKERLTVLRDRLSYKFKKKEWQRNRQNQCVSMRKKIYASYLPVALKKKTHFIEHHIAHYATAAFGAKYYGNKRYMAFTCDGQGDGRCATVHLIEKNGEIKFIDDIEDNNSIANLYALITCVMGFVVLEHEYKLMGMAPYANETRSKEVAKMFLDLFRWKDGKWFLKPGINRIRDTYEKPIIKKIYEICKYKRFDEICGGIQYAFETVLLKWIGYYTEKYEVDTIALAGGAFMNVKTNMLISQLPQINDMFVFPSCGDETLSIGAAMQQHYNQTEENPKPLDNMYLGLNYDQNDIEKSLENFKQKGCEFSVKKSENIEKDIALLLSQKNVVARFKGRSEFGARALGNRSILSHPTESRNIITINKMIKKRDFWMPFASSVLDTRADDYLVNPKGIGTPYMIMAFPGGDKVEDIYAGSHPQDHTVRPQIVTQESNPSYYNLIKHFEDLTGVGGILNTSFNLHGYPLVESPDDALDVFFKSGLKFLAIEDYLVNKPILEGK